MDSADNKTLSYAGIGSRETPPETLSLMTRLAARLEELGYTLHSGAAEGADTAFELGVKNPENMRIFLPWENFNKRNCPCEIPPLAYEIAKRFHPAWERLSAGAQKLMARNTQQVLGRDCKTPVNFVLCWHRGTGGTTQACRIAEHHRIPIVNIFLSDWRERIKAIVSSIMEVA